PPTGTGTGVAHADRNSGNRLPAGSQLPSLGQNGTTRAPLLPPTLPSTTTSNTILDSDTPLPSGGTTPLDTTAPLGTTPVGSTSDSVLPPTLSNPATPDTGTSIGTHLPPGSGVPLGGAPAPAAPAHHTGPGTTSGQAEPSADDRTRTEAVQGGTTAQGTGTGQRTLAEPVARSTEPLATGQHGGDRQAEDSSRNELGGDDAARPTSPAPLPSAVVPVDVSSITPSPTWSTQSELYRADSRDPAVLFTEGIHPRDPGNLDLYDFVRSGADERAAYGFVSTSSSLDRTLGRRDSGFVLALDAPGGIDVTETFADRGIPYEFAEQQEVVFPGGIGPQRIKGAWRIVPGSAPGDPNTLGEWIPNPNHTAPQPVPTTSEFTDRDGIRITTDSGDVLSRLTTDAGPMSETSSPPAPSPTATTAGGTSSYDDHTDSGTGTETAVEFGDRDADADTRDAPPSGTALLAGPPEPAAPTAPTASDPSPAPVLPGAGPLSAPIAGPTADPVLLTPGTALEGVPSPTGRDWTVHTPASAKPGVLIPSRISALRIPEGDPAPQDAGTRPAPWGSEAWVIRADLNERGLVIGPDGRPRTHEQIAETLANDPGRPAGVPVVLAVPTTGAGSQALQKIIAKRLGDVVVWAPTHDVCLHHQGDRSTLAITVGGDPAQETDWTDVDPAPAVVIDALLDPNSLLTGLVDPTGRSWTGGPGQDFGTVLTSTTSVYGLLPDNPAPQETDRVTSPWGAGAWVIQADADKHGRLIGPDGRALRHEDVAKTIAADPRRTAGEPVVLAVPYAGAGSQALLRAVAKELGESVWAPSLDGGLRKQAGVSDLAIYDHDPVDQAEPQGTWLRFDPPARDLPDRADQFFTAIVGSRTPFTHADVDGTIRVGDGRGTPAILNSANRYREFALEAFREHTRLTRSVDVAGQSRDLVDESDAPLDAAVRAFRTHGGPGAMELTVKGNTVWLDAEQGGRYIGTLRELAELPGDIEIRLQLCYGATPSDDPLAYAGNGTPPSPVADPLRTVSLAQHTANVSRRAVTAATFSAGINLTHRILWGLPGGQKGEWIRFLPEPTSDELGVLAVTSGLHPGPTGSDVPPATLETTLRLVRALRLGFGHDVEIRRQDYGDLLAGIAALETLRTNDKEVGALTPQFRMEIWHHLARKFDASPGPLEYETVLDWARRALRQSPTMELRALSPALGTVVRDHAAQGSPLLDSALGKISRPAGEPLTARALWALADAEQLILRPRPLGDQEQWARKVMHMLPRDRWDPNTHPARLRSLLARAFEQRLDATDDAQVSALDLWEKGYSDTSHAPRTSRHAVTWNWSYHDAPEGLDTAKLHFEVQEQDGTRKLLPVTPPWASGQGSGRPSEVPLVVWTELEHDGLIGIAMPGGTDLWLVTPAELRHLVITLDTATHERDQAAPFVFVTPTQDPSLAQYFANETGRHAYTYDGPTEIRRHPKTGVMRLVMLPRPDGTAPQWKRTEWQHPGLRDKDATVSPTVSADPATRDSGHLPGIVKQPGTTIAGPSTTTTGTGTGTGTGTAASTPSTTPVAATATAAATAPTETLENRLARRRPPRIDRDLPPPPAHRAPATFTDGSSLPAPTGNLAALIPLLPPRVLELSESYGVSTFTFRAPQAAVEEILRELAATPGLSPKPQGRKALPGTGLAAEITHAFDDSMDALIGEGVELTYSARVGKAAKATGDDGTRVLTLRLRPYAQWERFKDADARLKGPFKSSRAAATTGHSRKLSTSRQVNPVLPLLLPFTPAGVFTRFGLRLGHGRSLGFTLTSQVTTDTGVGASGKLLIHLTDVYVDFSVSKASLSTSDSAAPQLAGFAVRNGLSLKLGDAATKTPPVKKLPRTLDFPTQPDPGLIGTEAYGPLVQARDWTARQLGAAPGTPTYRLLDTFFSGTNFKHNAPVLAGGRLSTPPLTDAKGRPVGVFTVRTLSRRAQLVTDSNEYDVNNALTQSSTNERSMAKSRTISLQTSLGPMFDFVTGPVNLRLTLALLGLRATWGGTRSTGSGGSGSQVTVSGLGPKSNTGLYLVEKTVRVQRSGRNRKAPAGPGGLPPLYAPAEFTTWALERIPEDQARRLAGWDDGSSVPPVSGIGDPYAPAYLTRDNPPTLGFSRVEAFLFSNGSFTETPVATAPGAPPADGAFGRTALDRFTDEILERAAALYPGLVAPLAELDPANPKWRNNEHFELVLANTLEVCRTLAHAAMSTSLETLITTGLRIELRERGRFTTGYRYLWLDGTLTDRRFERTVRGRTLSFTTSGAEKLDAEHGGSRSLEAAPEASLFIRPLGSGPGNPGASTSGGFALTASAGRSKDRDNAFGQTASLEQTTSTSADSHLFSYELTFSVSRGGYWRPSAVLRGALSLGLLSTGLFVFRENHRPLGAPTPPAPTGRVLLSVAPGHTPLDDPDADTAPHPYRDLTRTVSTRSLPATDSFDLATGSPALLRSAATRAPAPHENHPVQTLMVMARPEIVRAAEDALRDASGDAWQLTHHGAPAHDAALRAFQSIHLTANSDQSMSASGYQMSGLWTPGPYGNRTTSLGHRMVLGDLRMLSGPTPGELERVISVETKFGAAEGSEWTYTFGISGSETTQHSVGPAGGRSGIGLGITPFKYGKGANQSAKRSVSADTSRADESHQVAVMADATHMVAAASTALGTMKAANSSLVPSVFGNASGSTVAVPGGWIGSLPEKSAVELGVIRDGFGPVPRYTTHEWSLPDWALGGGLASHPLNALNAAEVLGSFDRELDRLFARDTDRDAVHRLVSGRVLSAMKGEMSGAGASVPTRIAYWSWGSIHIGGQQVQVLAELIAEQSRFTGLGHSAELSDALVTGDSTSTSASRSNGFQGGLTTVQRGETGGGVFPNAGVTYTESGSVTTTRTSSRTKSEKVTQKVTLTGPHAEHVTSYRLRLTLQKADLSKPVSSEGAVGTQTTHTPLASILPSPSGTPGLLDAPAPLPAPGPVRSVPLPSLSGAADWRLVTYPDGSVRKFTALGEGFIVSRVPDAHLVREAAQHALAKAYNIGHRDPDTGDGTAPKWVQGTGLTRTGTGAAHALDSATAPHVLSAFAREAMGPEGYTPPPLSRRNPVGGAVGEVTVYARPELGEAQLLRVAGKVKQQVKVRKGNGGAEALKAGDTVGPTAGFLGQAQTGDLSLLPAGPASGPGEGTVDADSGNLDTSEGTKDKFGVGRSFLFAVPTSWVAVASVHREVKDSKLGRAVISPFQVIAGKHFGNPGPQAYETKGTVLAWVTEDAARRIGLITDGNFPQHVADSWDAVDSASDAWVEADKKYWSVRREAGTALVDAYNEAQERFDAATAAHDAAERRYHDAIRVMDETGAAATTLRQRAQRMRDRVEATLARAQRNVAQIDEQALGGTDTPADGDARVYEALAGAAALEALTALEEARAAYDAVTARADALELRADGISARAVTQSRLNATRARAARAARDVTQAALDAALQARDRARAAHEEVRNRLDTLQTAAEQSAADHHKAHSDAFRLTRWHELNDTEAGRAQLAGLAEPETVTFTAPATADPKPRVFERDEAADGAITLTAPGPAGRSVRFGVEAVPKDGNSFFHAFARSLAERAPLLAAGLPPADGMRAAFANELADPANDDLLATLATDEDDTFSTTELEAAGIDLAVGTPQRREYEDRQGVLPPSAKLSLTRDERLDLAVSQLMRDGRAADDSGWDHGAADLLPVLASRTYGVTVTVVDAEGRFQTFPSPTGQDAPHVVLYLADKVFSAALPLRTGEVAPPLTAAVPPAPTGTEPKRPAHSAPPWKQPAGSATAASKGFDAESDAEHLTITGPDGRVYDLVEPEGDGNGFYPALARALAQATAVPGPGAPAVPVLPRTPGAIASAVAAGVLPPSTRLDPQAVFHSGDRSSLAGALDADALAGLRADGGTLSPQTVAALDRAQVETLIRTQLLTARRWDAATAHLAVELATRALGVRITLVNEDGTSSSTPPDTALPELAVYQRGSDYLAALPRPLPPTATATTTADDTTAPAPQPPADTAPAPAVTVTPATRPATPTLPTAHERIPLAELDAAGLTLVPGIRAQAVMMGESLPVKDLGLSPRDLETLAAHRSSATPHLPQTAPADVHRIISTTFVDPESTAPEPGPTAEAAVTLPVLGTETGEAAFNEINWLPPRPVVNPEPLVVYVATHRKLAVVLDEGVPGRFAILVASPDPAAARLYAPLGAETVLQISVPAGAAVDLLRTFSGETGHSVPQSLQGALDSQRLLYLLPPSLAERSTVIGHASVSAGVVSEVRSLDRPSPLGIRIEVPGSIQGLPSDAVRWPAGTKADAYLLTTTSGERLLADGITSGNGRIALSRTKPQTVPKGRQLLRVTVAEGEAVDLRATREKFPFLGRPGSELDRALGTGTDLWLDESRLTEAVTNKVYVPGQNSRAEKDHELVGSHLGTLRRTRRFPVLPSDARLTPDELSALHPHDLWNHTAAVTGLPEPSKIDRWIPSDRPDWRSKPVWRVDGRDPELIFTTGMTPKSTRITDLHEHVTALTGGSGSVFVSWTKTPGLLRTAGKGAEWSGYFYVGFFPGGIDANESVANLGPTMNPHQKQQEVTALGGTRYGHIAGAFEILTDEAGNSIAALGEWLPNDGFDESMLAPGTSARSAAESMLLDNGIPFFDATLRRVSEPYLQRDGAGRFFGSIEALLEGLGAGAYHGRDAGRQDDLIGRLSGTGAVPGGFSHPEVWLDLLGGGPADAADNCVVTAMAVHSTFHGMPQVPQELVAPPVGAHVVAQEWSGFAAEFFGSGSGALAGVLERVEGAGEGSGALVFGEGADGWAHVWNLLFVPGSGLLWVDAHTGEVRPGDVPLHADGLGRVWAIPLDAGNGFIAGPGGFNALAEAELGQAGPFPPVQAAPAFGAKRKKATAAGSAASAAGTATAPGAAPVSTSVPASSASGAAVLAPTDVWVTISRPARLRRHVLSAEAKWTTDAWGGSRFGLTGGHQLSVNGSIEVWENGQSVRIPVLPEDRNAPLSNGVFEGTLRYTSVAWGPLEAKASSFFPAHIGWASIKDSAKQAYQYAVVQGAADLRRGLHSARAGTDAEKFLGVDHYGNWIAGYATGGDLRTTWPVYRQPMDRGAANPWVRVPQVQQSVPPAVPVTSTAKATQAADSQDQDDAAAPAPVEQVGLPVAASTDAQALAASRFPAGRVKSAAVVRTRLDALWGAGRRELAAGAVAADVFMSWVGEVAARVKQLPGAQQDIGLDESVASLKAVVSAGRLSAPDADVDAAGLEETLELLQQAVELLQQAVELGWGLAGGFQDHAADLMLATEVLAQRASDRLGASVPANVLQWLPLLHSLVLVTDRRGNLPRIAYNHHLEVLATAGVGLLELGELDARKLRHYLDDVLKVSRKHEYEQRLAVSDVVFALSQRAPETVLSGMEQREKELAEELLRLDQQQTNDPAKRRAAAVNDRYETFAAAVDERITRLSERVEAHPAATPAMVTALVPRMLGSRTLQTRAQLWRAREAGYLSFAEAKVLHDRYLGLGLKSAFERNQANKAAAGEYPKELISLIRAARALTWQSADPDRETTVGAWTRMQRGLLIAEAEVTWQFSLQGNVAWTLLDNRTHRGNLDSVLGAPANLASLMVSHDDQLAAAQRRPQPDLSLITSIRVGRQELLWAQKLPAPAGPGREDLAQRLEELTGDLGVTRIATGSGRAADAIPSLARLRQLRHLAADPSAFDEELRGKAVELVRGAVEMLLGDRIRTGWMNNSLNFTGEADVLARVENIGSAAADLLRYGLADLDTVQKVIKPVEAAMTLAQRRGLTQT
ncbi:lonely Cys domain-containing protein, partial [Streptomyces sp. NPDC056492]|uniref:lonely Cys domain-containing protein n=1 Tax=Streptomyces sp. NPDC056492 TaxID=3345838 RepID=UPI00369C2F27